MQYAVFSAQREAAIAGDQELSELLTDILVDRAAEDKRNLKRIVLDEALAVDIRLFSGGQVDQDTASTAPFTDVCVATN